MSDDCSPLGLSDKALETLRALQALQQRCDRDMATFVTSDEAELFQYRLGSLLVFCGGGVLRPSSVAGLVMSSNVAASIPSIRALGYMGALAWAIEDSASHCILIHVVTFKNMASYAVSARICYVLSSVVSDLLMFFWRRVRPSLRPLPNNPFVFVKPGDGRWFDVARGDRFGALCGERGLQWGTSVRVVRHVVSTAIADAVDVTPKTRADMCAANLHTVAVADRYYVVPTISATSSSEGRGLSGEFVNGLGKSTTSFSPLYLFSSECCADYHCFLVYALFPAAFRQAFGVPINYKSILQSHFGSLEPSVSHTLLREAAAADFTAEDVPMTDALALLAADPTSMDDPVTAALAVNDELDVMSVLGSPSTVPSPLLKVLETNAIITAASRVVVATQICSLCSKVFEKSKSHQGTRCWSCKKKSKLPLADI